MSKTITDFKEWLGMVEPNVEEIHNIYNAVERKSDFADVNVSQNPNRTWLVEYYAHDPLLLTDLSRKAMLRHIEHEYCKGLDMESWYGQESTLNRN